MSAWAQPLLEVSKIADKSQQEVSIVLGQHCGEEVVPAGTWRTYRQGEIKVMFIGDKANLITISGMEGVKQGEGALRVLGLKPETSTFEDYYTIRWQPHSTFAMIDMVALRGEVVSAMIKVRD